MMRRASCSPAGSILGLCSISIGIGVTTSRCAAFFLFGADSVGLLEVRRSLAMESPLTTAGLRDVEVVINPLGEVGLPPLMTIGALGEPLEDRGDFAATLAVRPPLLGKCEPSLRVGRDFSFLLKVLRREGFTAFLAGVGLSFLLRAGLVPENCLAILF